MTTPEQEIARLHALLAEKDSALAEKDDALAKEKQRGKKLAEKVKVLEHQLGLLKKQLFGKKSEKLDPRQLRLAFDAACAEAAEADAPLSDEPYPEDLLAELARTEQGEEPNGKRRPKRKTKFPSDLDVVRDEEIHPSPEQLRCPF